MELDANKVIEMLKKQVSDLNYENILLKLQIYELSKEEE